MRDIEQELRELGKRTREQVGRTETTPELTRRVRARRALVATTTTLGLLLVTAGGIYGASLMSSERGGTDIAAEEVMSGRYFPRFGEKGQAIVEIDVASRSVCFNLSGVEGGDVFSNVDIYRTAGRGPSVLALRPTENGFTPNGGGECVRAPNALSLQSIVEAPQQYALQLRSDAALLSAPLLPDPVQLYAHFGPRGTAVITAYVEGTICFDIGGVQGAADAQNMEIRGDVGDGVVIPFSPADEAYPCVRSVDRDHIQRMIADPRAFSFSITEGNQTSSAGLTFTEQNPDVEEGHERKLREEIEDIEDEIYSDQGEDGFAVWPYVTLKQARMGCADATPAGRTARGVTERFAKEVLRWPEAVVELRAATGTYGIIRKTPDTPEGIRGNVWVGLFNPRYEDASGPDCFLIRSVARPPDKRITGMSVSVRGRTVSVGCSSLGADDAEISITYGQGGLGKTHGDSGGTFELDFKPRTTGAFLILLKEEGEVFSACGAALPAGDFAAG